MESWGPCAFLASMVNKVYTGIAGKWMAMVFVIAISAFSYRKWIAHDLIAHY